MSFWHYWQFRFRCLQQPFIDGIKVLEQSGFALVTILGAALPAAAFSLLYGFGLVFDVNTSISATMLASWLILLVQSVCLYLLKDALVAKDYRFWLASLPIPVWYSKLTTASLACLTNIMLWPVLIILLGVDLSDWHRLGHVFLFLLVQLCLAGLMLSSVGLSGIFLTSGYFVVSSLSASQQSQDTAIFTHWPELSAAQSSQLWMAILLVGVLVSMLVKALVERSHLALSSKPHFSLSAKLSLFLPEPSILVLAWLKSHLASGVMRLALGLLLIALAEFFWLQTYTPQQNLGDIIGHCLLVLLVLNSGSWQLSVSQWLKLQTLYFSTLPRAKYVKLPFMMLPSILLAISLILAKALLSYWFVLTLGQWLFITSLLLLLQYLSHRQPRHFTLSAMLIMAIYVGLLWSVNLLG